MSATKPRLLIFVIAYHAEETLESVLDRIPAEVHSDYETEILVVDDASVDRTAEIGRAWRVRHPDLHMSVIRNELNQGYGGNQKVGYAYAIRGGFDLVAMVHGDGQYAPERLPQLLEPLRNGEADAVFGTRMAIPTDALKGGMPLYKFVGNRILTIYQNTMLGTTLTEFHSGYRLYSVKTLAQLPLRLNTNDFHFDTEIILQLHAAGARVREIPIPTYYGDEISRVNGLRYAKDVVLATLRYALHRRGLLYQRRFDTDPPGHNSQYTLKLGYPSTHSYVLDRIPSGAKVLDLGGGGSCGMARLLADKGCSVTVLDRGKPPADLPESVHFQPADLDRDALPPVTEYEYLLLLDVIEHLAEPEEFVERLRARFDYTPRTFVLTTPNIAFIVTRFTLLLGQFNYGKVGILDRTHRRLFTFRSVRQLLRDTGFVVREVKGVPAPFVKAIGPGKLASFLTALHVALIKLRPQLFAYQIYVEAETRPDVDFVLRDSLTRVGRGSTVRPPALSP